MQGPSACPGGAVRVRTAQRSCSKPGCLWKSLDMSSIRTALSCLTLFFPQSVLGIFTCLPQWKWEQGCLCEERAEAPNLPH